MARDSHPRPGTAEAGALQDVDPRLSKGLRKADDQGHPQGDGHAEPQIVHSHHLRFHCAAMDARIDGGLLSGQNRHELLQQQAQKGLSCD